VSIITYALPGRLPLHANTTQIADVRVQEDCCSNSKYYIHYIPEPTCRGSAPLYAPPLSYKRGGMQRNTRTHLHMGTDLDPAQAHSDTHKFIQALKQYITQWSRVLRSGGPNHSRSLCVIVFFPFSN
jgi:hypothetical protein